MKRLKSYWESKSVRQRIYLCIVLVLILMFAFFVVKGNIFDKLSSTPPQDSSKASDEIHFHISWIDIGVLAAVFGAYGIHKYREKKKGKRL